MDSLAREEIEGPKEDSVASSGALSTWVFVPPSLPSEPGSISQSSTVSLEGDNSMTSHMDFSLPPHDSCFCHLFPIHLQGPLSSSLIIHLRSIRTFTIGRAPNSDIFLDSASLPKLISRKHGIIQPQLSLEDDLNDGEEAAPEWRLIATHSSDIYVNNKKIQDAILSDGDVISFGTSLLEDCCEFTYLFKIHDQSNKRKKGHETREKSTKKTKVDQSTLLKQLVRQTETIHLQDEQRTKDGKQETDVIVLEEDALPSNPSPSFSESGLPELQKQLEMKNKEVDSKNQEIQAWKESIDSMEEELKCYICQELILSAHTLECAHSFCQTCITDWLRRKKQCPVCRHNLTKPIYSCRMVDNVISRLIKSRSPEAQNEWKDRIQAREKILQEEANYNSLLQKINEAKQKRVRFLSVTEPWNETERRIFQEGVMKYGGRCRELYCESAGLSKSFIEEAPTFQLRLAAANLGIAASHYNTHELKRRLLGFLSGSSSS